MPRLTGTLAFTVALFALLLLDVGLVGVVVGSIAAGALGDAFDRRRRST